MSLRLTCRTALAAGLCAGLLPGAAQAKSAPRPPSDADRVTTLLVYGNDACPKSSNDEIVVCARLPEGDRYRIPQRFRKKADTGPAGTAWGARVRSMEYVGRDSMPNSCTPVGSGGQTGCYHQFLAQARAERQAAQAAAQSGQ